jgi:hypothetical protein
MDILLKVIVDKIPHPILPILKPKSQNLKALARAILHAVLDALRAIDLYTDLFRIVVNDSYEYIEFLTALATPENSKIISSIYDFILVPSNLKKIWEIQSEISNLVGETRVADRNLFKVLYRLIVSSGLSIS